MDGGGGTKMGGVDNLFTTSRKKSSYNTCEEIPTASSSSLETKDERAKKKKIRKSANC